MNLEGMELDAAYKLLRNGFDFIVVLLRSRCEAVENISKPLRLQNVLSCFEAVAEPFQRTLESWS